MTQAYRKPAMPARHHICPCVLEQSSVGGLYTPTLHYAFTRTVKAAGFVRCWLDPALGFRADRTKKQFVIRTRVQTGTMGSIP